MYQNPENKNGASQAKESLHAALRAEPTCIRALFGLGVIARVEGDAKAAERQFRRVLELNKKHAEAAQELRILEMKRKAR